MVRISPKTRRLFADFGRRGGVKRCRSLSGFERSRIAKKAAMARWGQVSQKIMTSIRFDKPDLTNPAFLEELLAEGSLDDWKILRCEVANRPFGLSAVALKKVMSSTKIYGVTPLWKGILKNAQGGFL